MLTSKFSVKRFIALTLILIITVGILSWKINQTRTKQMYRELAVQMAKSYFQMILVQRNWNADHGGVYIPVTEQTKPNKYLDDPLRNLKFSESLTLTKINPAYMTRLLSEKAKEYMSVQFHITSLNPINPGNTPDDWEQISLKLFEDTRQSSTWEVKSYKKSTYLRYMEPLLMEKECLKCHAKQGYKLGDIRGGISVNIPYAPFQEAIRKDTTDAAIQHILFAAILFSVIYIFGRKTLAGEQELSKYSSRLKTLAETDALTGVFNRRQILQSLMDLIHRSRAGGQPLSFIIMDLDGFKEVNDTFGHIVGDKVLAQFANLICQNVRSIDIVGRYGGDEFVVILPETTAKDAKFTAERIRSAVANRGFKGADTDIHLTASLGVATATHFQMGDKKLRDELLNKADTSLYTAKRKGKNMVESINAEG
ncbi:diguanylate cyclase [Metallumcola ferriviriculae]|uniref:Diguanylate cyclase n=1 Tax=Metallumcola ferriviriculae TaxID=3039180 RepID=A0AAU0UNN4_9FIRM|nr:diguanylate cyclase [Desulfitibacteraceae bacterium MK1]